MAFTRNRRSMPAPSLAFLLEELAAVARTTWRDHRRRIDRLAITFRPCKQGRDGISDHPILFDGFRLLALTHGWAEGRRGPRPRTTLTICRPIFNRKDPVPIRFRPEQVHDLSRPRTLTGPRPHATAIRSAIVLHQAIEDAGPVEFAAAPELPRFFYGFHPTRAPQFESNEPDAAMRMIDGLKAWPAEFFAGAADGPLQGLKPKRVFASLAHLKGRVVRNPAFAVLKRHGLLPRGQSYRSWLASVSVTLDGVRVAHDPTSGRSETARIRRLIESHVLADRAREGAMLGDLEAACTAMGVKLPEGEERLDRLATLLDNPWEPAAAPYASRVQLVKPDGSALETLTEGGAVPDLDEVGRYSGMSPATPVGPGGRRG